MNRRGFLGSILAAAAAPAIVRADSLMRIVPMDTAIFTASDITLSLDEYAARYVEPAVRILADELAPLWVQVLQDVARKDDRLTLKFRRPMPYPCRDADKREL